MVTDDWWEVSGMGAKNNIMRTVSDEFVFPNDAWELRIFF